MSVIDKVSVGGTTYDVQDTEARASALAALDAQSAVDFGWVAGDQTITGAGITAVRNGNRITLNGTATSGLTSAQRFRMMGNLVTVNGSPTAAQNVSGAVLTNGHRYMTVMRLVSGTAVYSGDDRGFLTLAPYKSGSTSVYFDEATASDDYTYYIRGGYGDGNSLTLWVSFRSGWTFTNAVYEISVYDVTAMVDTDSSIRIATYSASAPSITALPGVRYVCSASYVTSLSFTPSATGICSVRFTSGTTPTVLSVPNTVVWPDWFDPEHLEASRTYEISIEDGIYGAVTSWA